MISSNDFRPGVHVLLDGDLYAIVESQHVKVGRGPAYVKAKVRNTKTGSITERTFRAGERVPLVYLEKRTMQYLYGTGDEYVVMDKNSYEQLTLGRALFGDAVRRSASTPAAAPTSSACADRPRRWTARALLCYNRRA